MIFCICYNADRQSEVSSPWNLTTKTKTPVLQHWGFSMPQRTLTLRRPHFDQVAVRVIKAEHFLAPAMGHEAVDILNGWI